MPDWLWQLLVAAGGFFGGRAFKSYDDRNRQFRAMHDGIVRLTTATELNHSSTANERRQIREEIHKQGAGIKEELHQQVQAIRDEIRDARLEAARRVHAVEERTDALTEMVAQQKAKFQTVEKAIERLAEERGCPPPAL